MRFRPEIQRVRRLLDQVPDTPTHDTLHIMVVPVRGMERDEWESVREEVANRPEPDDNPGLAITIEALPFDEALRLTALTMS